MPERPFSSGNQFRWAYLRAVSPPGTAAAVLVVAYYAVLIDLNDAMWRAVGIAVAIAAVVLTPLCQILQRRIESRIVRTIDREAAGLASHDEIRAAFADATAVPLRGTVALVSIWVVAAALVPVVLIAALEDGTGFAISALTLASFTAGLATAPFNFYRIRAVAAPQRDYWARQLDSQERAEANHELSLRWKLVFPISAISLATVAFAGMLTYSMASGAVELRDAHVKEGYLGAVARQVGEGGTAVLAEVEKEARRFGVAEAILLIDAHDGAVLEGDADLLTPSEIALVRASESSGTGAAFESRNSFAWSTIADGDWILVAATPRRSFSSTVEDMLLIWGLVAVAVVGFSTATAWLVMRDILGTSRALRDEVERVAGGDLRPGNVIESEDELGRLSRTFDRMVISVRETVTAVADAASLVDGSAADLVSIGTVVAGATADQVSGIEQATASMGAIREQVSGITRSSEILTGHVEEASSSVLELGAAGEEMNQTAVALNAQVEEVSNSIEQMIRSVSQVGENTEGLSEAVLETSSSMSEMTRSTQAVEGHATETARLSNEVIEFSEDGRVKVQETIRGMEDIRDATTSAEDVIRSLAGRMKEIGAIVDVIDDVADETNLLALNAAIIAAQSGDQGRAFSVVADEIKDLADRVLSSTKEIDSLIRAVQSESSNAAQAIQLGAESVQSGVDLSAQAGVSLEEITSAARDSGSRIDEIVHAMQEQSRGAGHVEGLMQRVSRRVEEISRAAAEQEHGNEVVMRGSVVMREVAQQTQNTTEEQSRGALRIRESMESVRDTVEQIHRSLQGQSEATNEAASFLEQIFQRTHAHDESTEKMLAAAESLKAQANGLRDNVRRFRTA
jgi:methyl-accepting chemotaxis protein